MNTMLQAERSTPVKLRIQKIRERMKVEALFDVPAANKNVFLLLCLRYEQKIAANGEAFWKHYDTTQEWDHGPWTDWHDWHNFSRKC